MVPVPHLIEVSEKLMAGGPTVYRIKIHESGKARLRALRVKLTAVRR
jgi:hypothetical protein